MPDPVVHFEIVSETKAKELQEFYSNLFGWTINADNPYNYGQVNTGAGRGINGGIGPSPSGNRVTIYTEVEDLQAALDKAESLGGKTLMAPEEIPGAVTMAMFADPDGNVVGLIKSGSMR
jgi:predicted enzyme related to lactoylglutathione lyase